MWVSLERLITLSVLLIGFFFGVIGLASPSWYAKVSHHQSVALTFQDLARQSNETVGLFREEK